MIHRLATWLFSFAIWLATQQAVQIRHGKNITVIVVRHRKANHGQTRTENHPTE